MTSGLISKKFWLRVSWDFSSKQGGITCGAIDEPRKSSKAIDERVIINLRYIDKNDVLYFYDKMS